MTQPSPTTQRPTGEELTGIGRAEFITLMSMITATVAISIDTVLPAFDEIEDEFALGSVDSPISLTVTVFLAAMGAGMLIWGPLADRFGRKKMMFIALSLFITGSVISTIATSFPMFLAGRVLWGAASAGPRAISLAITRDAYGGDLMARIMSLTSAVFLLVPVLAPAVGEGVLAIGSWRWTTAVATALGVVAAAWFTRINETLAPDDVLPLEVGRIAVAAQTVVRNRTTVYYTIATMAAYGAFFPWLGSSTTMIGDIYGRSDQFALLFGLNALLMAIAIITVERLVRHYSTFPVLAVQTVLWVIAAAVYVIWFSAEGGVPTFWLWFAGASVLTAFSSGAGPLMQTLSMEPMGKIAGTASSVTGAVIFIGGALLGSLIDRQIIDTVTPFGTGFLLYGIVAMAATFLGHRASVGAAGTAAG
ncbi:MAG: MFS transporter [Acidimicrobiia bacterium]|nr:MFS transporter [Acidimicrobiia bacterium]